jgi:drug/metabolite transporter (DMT)-like permease
MKLAINKRMLIPLETRPRVSAMPQWITGFSLFAFGTGMSFGAFKFAAQSLLAGLGSVQFLSQVFFSRFILHERVESYAYFGVALIIVGCVFLVIFGAHETKNYKVGTWFALSHWEPLSSTEMVSDWVHHRPCH